MDALHKEASMKPTKKTLREIKRLVAYFGGTETLTADAVGVRQPTVNAWLNGRHGISAITALKIERMTGGKFKASDLCPQLAEVAA